MEQGTTRGPFYQRLSYNLLTLALLCIGLIYGKSIVLPILFAILLANLLLPVTQKLAERINRPLSILIPLIVSVLLIATVIFFISSQIVNFVDDLPSLTKRFNELTTSVQKWIRENTHITIQRQNQYFSKGVENLQDDIPKVLGSTFFSLAESLAYALLVPIFTFLILYYRNNIRTFLVDVFRNGSEEKVTQVLNESTHVAQKYMIGLLIETAFVFTLNLLGFWIIGIKYTVLLALLAALLNLIPYMGMITANILCMLVTLITSDSPGDVIWVGVALALVQVLDNNFGMPLIVGSKVQINALVTIVGVIIGGMLCGIPGMFLAIPGIAVLKIIFDKVPGLKPWGVLLGDDREGKKKTKLTLIREKTTKVKYNKVPV